MLQKCGESDKGDLQMNYEYSPRMENLPFSEIRKVMEKADEMIRNGEKIIHLELGRPDFDTPEVIKDSAKKALDDGNVFYTSNYGTLSLRKAVAEKLKRENHIDCSYEEILITAGLSEAVYDLFGALVSEGDEVLIPDPVWLNYIYVPKYFGAVPVTYSLKEENDFCPDIEELEKLVTPKTKLMVIISPNNPTGGVIGRENLEKIAAFAKKHNILIVSDEIYEKLIYDDTEHISIASLDGMHERTITLNGFSKAYSMTGWRLGYMQAPKEIISAAVRMHQYIATCASSFGQAAAVTALEKGEPDVIKMNAEYKRRRDYVVDAIESIPHISCVKPKGTFYIFINVSELGISCEEVAEYLLVNGKIALVPGTAFGKNGKGYVRLSFANSYENLVEACEALKRCTEEIYAANH